MPNATQTQLAEKLGLSRSTVAAALNPNSPIKLREDTRARVLAAAAEMEYRPNHHARVMRGGRTGLIGVFHFGGLSQVAAERAWHASRAIEAAGFKILSSEVSWSSGGAKAGCEAMLDARVEGIVVSGLNDTASVEELLKLQKAGIPLVTLSGNKLSGVPHVRGDASEAFQRMTRHLIDLGRRRLLLLASASEESRTYVWAGTERLKGFKAGLEEVAAAVVETFSGAREVEGKVILSHAMEDRFDPFRTGRETMHAILKQRPPWPDAVVCGNDDWALGAMAGCRDLGLQIPRDIAVTGYDNTAVGAYLAVPLTTVAQPSREMAEKAVEILFALIQGERIPKSASQIKFQCELVLRESCGANLP